MKKQETKVSKQETAPVAAEPVEPEVPQSGTGQFQYKNLTTYSGEWKLVDGNKLKHGKGKVVFPGNNTKGNESYDGEWQDD